jgi:hypothetical protein
MPSLHFGWDLLVGIALATLATTWWPRCVGVAMPVAMAFAIVATANHFVIDVVAGGTLAMVGLAAAIHLQPTIRDVQREPRRTRSGSSSGRPERGTPHALK